MVLATLSPTASVAPGLGGPGRRHPVRPGGRGVELGPGHLQPELLPGRGADGIDPFECGDGATAPPPHFMSSAI